MKRFMLVSVLTVSALASQAALANPDLGRDLAGMARHFDTARVLNSFAVVEQARRSLDRILAWDFDRVVVAHGDVLERGGRELLREGYAWLLARGA